MTLRLRRYVDDGRPLPEVGVQVWAYHWPTDEPQIFGTVIGVNSWARTVQVRPDDSEFVGGTFWCPAIDVTVLM